MSDVHILHQQITIANNSFAFWSRATTDSYILSDGVVVPNLAGSLFALKLQILRLGRDGSTGENFVIIA